MAQYGAYDNNQPLETTGNFEQDKANIQTKFNSVQTVLNDIAESCKRIKIAWQDSNDPEGDRYKKSCESLIEELTAQTKQQNTRYTSLLETLDSLSKNINARG